jgi:hypothetical protein
MSIASEDLPKRFPKSKTGFSLQAGIASASVMCSILFFYYFINDSISVVLDYCVSLLISAYMQCAFVHLKHKQNLALSFMSLFVCFFYMCGCSLGAIVFGLVVSYTSNIIFLLLSKKDDQQESLED